MAVHPVLAEEAAMTTVYGHAERVAWLVQRDPCGGLPELELQETLAAWDTKLWKRILFTAYRQQWIDFGSGPARGYIFAAPPGSPGRIAEPAQVAAAAPQPVRPDRRIQIQFPEDGPVFAVVCRDGVVVEAPPVAGWAVGRPEAAVAKHYRAKGATFATLPRTPLLLVSGPREGVTRATVALALAPWFDPATVLLVGGARGVDRDAAELWEEWGGQVETDRVTGQEWDASRGAGHARNGRMVNRAAAVAGAQVVVFDLPCTRSDCDRAGPHNTHGTSGLAVAAERVGLPVEHTSGGAT